MRIGVLALQGDVSEHVLAAEKAAAGIKLRCDVAEVRTRDALEGLAGLIIPGGESTTMHKLCEREGMLGTMKRIPAIFGTCAGAIMLARALGNKEAGQGTLGLMDIRIDRNAYGRQSESFEQEIGTALGRVDAVFIRAPRIRSVGEGVRVLARRGKEAVACEQRGRRRFLMAACFHPELTTTRFHGYFLKNVRQLHTEPHMQRL
jgi:5'-phosphate synthase pdxT subunit